MVKRSLALFLILTLSISLVSCGGKSGGEKLSGSVPQLSGPSAGDTVVTIVTSEGTIKAVLFEDLVPDTAQNFIRLAETGYYDGMVIHKVISDFVVQLGDKTLRGDGGESYSGTGVAPEFRDDLHSYTGSLGMVVYPDGLQYSQFFIVAGSEVSEEYIQAMNDAGYSQDVIDAFKQTGGQPGFDYVYTVFGQVFEGIDTVKALASKETDKYNRPKKDVTVTSITVSSYTEG